MWCSSHFLCQLLGRVLLDVPLRMAPFHVLTVQQRWLVARCCTKFLVWQHLKMGSPSCSFFTAGATFVDSFDHPALVPRQFIIQPSTAGTCHHTARSRPRVLTSGGSTTRPLQLLLFWKRSSQTPDDTGCRGGWAKRRKRVLLNGLPLQGYAVIAPSASQADEDAWQTNISPCAPRPDPGSIEPSCSSPRC